MPVYRCNHCGLERNDKRKQKWIKSYCAESNRTVHMMRMKHKKPLKGYQ